MDEDEYTTVEHDYRHMKDFLNTSKFNYLEKLTRYYLTKNINNPNTENLDELVNQNKEELVKIKEKNKKLESEFENLSLELYNLQNKNLQLKNQTNELTELIDYNTRIAKELVLENENKKQINYFEKLKSELQSEIEFLMFEIDNLENIDLESLEKKNSILRKRRDSLIKKQKRWSVINFENCIQELYDWYSLTSKFICKLFNVDFITLDNSLEMKFNNKKFHFFIENHKFVCMKGIKNYKIDKLEKFCIENNLLILLILYLIANE